MNYKWKILSLLTMGIFLYGCNEKISPELQTGSSTTTPPVVTPSEYYFRVKNESAEVLNYVLHRTGPLNQSKSCEVKSTFPLSSDFFIGDNNTALNSKSYDITCFFETEELSLFFNGLDYKLEASSNTCEYIGYSPYSYFDAIPGSSSATYAGVKCDAPYTNAEISSIVTGNGITYGGGLPVACGKMVDMSLPEALRVPGPLPEEEDFQLLCNYDYEKNGGGNGQNCDEGRIKFQILSIVDTDPEPPKALVGLLLITPDHTCDGSVAACVAGAIKSEPTLAEVERGTVIYNTSLNTAFAQTYNLPKLYGKRYSNFDIVNFRKGLANRELNFQDYSPLFESEWSDTTADNNMTFDPNVMEKWAINKKPDGSVVIDTNDSASGTGSDPNNATLNYTNYLAHTRLAGSLPNQRTRTPFAGDPFLGLNGRRINPFYTFYCLDRAYEVKARIRMVVRDWDKVFSTGNSALTLLSDSYKMISARQQDLPSDEEENVGDEGTYNYFNDIHDWDNLVLMNRTNTNGDPYTIFQSANGSGSIHWEPSSGFLNEIIFPNQGPLE